MYVWVPCAWLAPVFRRRRWGLWNWSGCWKLNLGHLEQWVLLTTEPSLQPWKLHFKPTVVYEVTVFRHSISYKGCFLSPCGMSLFLLFQLTQSGCVPVSSPTSSEFLRSHPMNGAAWHRETHPDDRGQEPTILNQPSGEGGQLEINLLLSDFIKIRTQCMFLSLPC